MDTSSPHPKKLRGIGFEVEEMMKLFLVIIIGLGVVILIIAASGGISSMLAEFCAKNPNICGGTQTQADYNNAKVSVQALVLASNCVSDQAACRCMQSPCVLTADGVNKAGFALSGLQISTTKSTSVSCQGTPLECKVTNFYLPDNFEGISGSAQAQIEGFGDPNVLVYFQNFPQGEDASWVQWSPWYKGIGAMMFLSMCLGDFVRPVFKGVNLLRPTKMAEALQQIPGALTKVEERVNYVKGLMQRSTTSGELKVISKTDFKTTYVWDPTAKSFSITELMNALKEDSIKWASENWKGATLKAATYSGLDSAAAYGAARLDSELGKIVYENPQSIVLQTPLKKGEPFAVNGLKTSSDNIQTGMPIILDKGGAQVQLSLASPCHADLTVKKAEVKCGSYTYRSNGKIECHDISSASSSDANCGSLPQANPTLYTQIKSLVTSADKKIFESQNSEIRKIYLPFWGNKYIGEIEQKTCYGGYSNTFQCYRGYFYEDSNILSDSGIPSEADKVQIACGSVDSIIAVSQQLLIDLNKNKFFDGSSPEEKTKVQLCFMDLSLTENAKVNEKVLKSIGRNNYFMKYDGKFTTEIIYPNVQSFVVLKDTDDDSKWNTIMMIGVSSIAVPVQSSWSLDLSRDGSFSSVTTMSCRTPALKVSADAKGYSSDKYNFCYSKDSTWTGVAITTTSFLIDAFAKKTPVGWVAGTAADCGLAWLELSYQQNWPSGGIK